MRAAGVDSVRDYPKSSHGPSVDPAGCAPGYVSQRVSASRRSAVWLASESSNAEGQRTLLAVKARWTMGQTGSRWTVGVVLLLVVSACGPSDTSVPSPGVSPDPAPAATDVARGVCEEVKAAIAEIKAEHAALPAAADDARTLRAAIRSIGRTAGEAYDLGQKGPLPEVVMAVQFDLLEVALTADETYSSQIPLAETRRRLAELVPALGEGTRRLPC